MTTTADAASRYLPADAPPRPDNVILERLAWSRMWLEDDNTIWTVIGDTGKGKSYASLRLAEQIDPDFTADQVAQNVVEFMELVMDDSYGRGTVIVFEEASVEASAYDWHSVSNRVFAKVLDTWRKQNRMAIINLPNFKALEKGARRRTNAIVEMQTAKPWMDYSQGKFLKVNYHPRYDDFNDKFPIIDGKKRKWIRFSMPSEELREDYEALKDEYTEQLNEELLEELLGLEEEEEQMGPQQIADEIVESGVTEYISDNNGQKYIDRSLIELDYDVGQSQSKKVKKAIQRQVDVDAV